MSSNKKVVGLCRHYFVMELPCNWVNKEGWCGVDCHPCKIIETRVK